jgi:hypothetical protein
MCMGVVCSVLLKKVVANNESRFFAVEEFIVLFVSHCMLLIYLLSNFFKVFS